MLASTMQHSTHHHTPKHTTTTTTPTHGCVRRSRPGAATRKNNPPTGRCLLRTQQCAEPIQLLALCSTQPHPTTCQRCGTYKKETRDDMPPVCLPIRGSSL